MTDAIRPCGHGCTIRGSHRTDCTGTNPAGKPCTGCLPRPAEGYLCEWCYSVLTGAIEAIPDLVAHLYWIGEPVAQNNPATDTPPSREDPALADALPAPWLAADELESMLTGWAHVITEEHPNQPMRGPNAAPWHGDTVAWMRPHLPWVRHQYWSVDMRYELPRETATLRARWPTIEDTEGARRVTMPCPRCDQLTLTYTPPRNIGDKFVVSCDNPDCARVFSEDEFEWFQHMALTS